MYLPTNGIKVGGILKTVFGGILTGVFGIATMVVGGIGAGFSSSVMLGISAVLAAFTVGGGILLGQGCSSLTSLSRRNKYIKLLALTPTAISSSCTGSRKPVKFVKKISNVMISKGWFLQGHVDKQETCLITSNETYDQYVSTQKRLEERDHQQDEERARQEAALRQQAEEKKGRNLTSMNRQMTGRVWKQNGMLRKESDFPRKSGRFWIREMTFLIKSTAAMMPFQEKRFPENLPYGADHSEDF